MSHETIIRYLIGFVFALITIIGSLSFYVYDNDKKHNENRIKNIEQEIVQLKSKQKK